MTIFFAIVAFSTLAVGITAIIIALIALNQRLRGLEVQGIVERVIYPEVPPRVEYSLTEKGKRLRAILDQMRTWGSL